MSGVWAVATMVSGGLYVGGVVFIAWERIPAWRLAAPTEFRAAFAYTLRRADPVQPALLVVLIVSTIGLVATTHATARLLGLVAAVGFLAILVGSAVRLVPIQRRLTSETTSDVERLRTRWLRGHQIRTVAALVLFVLASAAVAI